MFGLVVATALAFDFTNGFHDTANAMATSIATGALKPRVAVALSAVLNLVGAFLSLAVAATIASGIVDQNFITLQVVFAIGVVVVMASGIHLYSRSEGRVGAQKVINLAGAIIALLIVLAVVGLSIYELTVK